MDYAIVSSMRALRQGEKREKDNAEAPRTRSLAETD
jgi:hypothetical protein